MDFTLTVEYVESRADKLNGRNKFEGRIVDDLKDIQQKYKTDADKLKRQEELRDKELAKLDKLCDKFNMQKVRGSIVDSID